MGVYNCENTVEEAIQSLQNQTYTNWEFIVCDDGSIDHTYDKVLSISKKDPRIVVMRNEYNLGLNKTLNRCLKYTSGKYIARMDGDDISVSTRFEKEIEFLLTHSEFEIVSCPMILFDSTGDWGQTTSKEYPTKEDVVCGTAICHAPVMMTRHCLIDVNGYTEDVRMLRVEDVNLWIKLYARGYRCYNIQEPLYKMRNDQNALNRRKYKYRINSTYVRLRGCKELDLGLKYKVMSFRPMVAGLVPAKLRQHIRKKQRSA